MFLHPRAFATDPWILAGAFQEPFRRGGLGFTVMAILTGIAPDFVMTWLDWSAVVVNVPWAVVFTFATDPWILFGSFAAAFAFAFSLRL